MQRSTTVKIRHSIEGVNITLEVELLGPEAANVLNEAYQLQYHVEDIALNVKRIIEEGKHT